MYVSIQSYMQLFYYYFMKFFMKLLSTAFLVFAFQFLNAQQIIGMFPEMDGGYENQPVTTAIPSVTNSSSPTTYWARSSATGTPTIRSISNTGARSGSNMLSVNNSATGTVALLSPYVPTGNVSGGGSYIVQFYYRATDLTTLPNTQITVGVSNAPATQVTATNFFPNAIPNNANWVKSTTPVVAANGATAGTGFSAIRIAGTTTTPAITTNAKGIDIDDWVIYPGTSPDVTPPSNPGNITVGNVSGTTIDLSWVASNNVDAGGYMVIRYTSNPTGQVDPNENGIYKTGNTIGGGVVVYTGTANSFSDFNLSNNTTYFYRVYAVDKAFNYSGYSLANATTNSTVVTIQYYLDATAGNDNNAGTQAAPWQNLTKLNLMTLIPGTQVFLKCGSIWNGQQLKFKGSGINGNSIVIDKYGTGQAPQLNGNGLTGEAVVYLYNQQYIEINNLEITNAPNGPINSDFFVGVNDGTTNNNPLGADRRGVMVVIDNYGVANHVYLKNLNVHHIKGQLGNGSTAVNGAIPKRTGGIFFTVLGRLETTATKSRFNDVLIDGCNINYCENMGLAFDNEWNVYYPGSTEYNDWYARRFSNVKVSNNIIHHIGKNAMIIRCTDETGLIERNICYETAVGTTGNTMFTARAKGTVFQYNEGYYNRSTTQNVDPGNIDGSMYDPDFGSVGIIFQYSYSHDNSEGIYWGCNTRGSGNNTTGIPDPEDVGCTLRYCVSQNDKGGLVYFNYSSAGNEIYNNVFYTKSGLSPTIIRENGGNGHTYNFFNNIIYNLSGSADYNLGGTTAIQNRTIQYNVFYGNHPPSEPSDPFKITADPLFVSPGIATFGIGSMSGYKLQPTSPVKSNGKAISNNGGRDYYGTTLPITAPNRGIYEGPGVGSLPVVLSHFDVYKNQNKALLSWISETENNVAYFDVEKSNNARTFKKIGSVVAIGNSFTNRSYSFTDMLLEKGNNYYRLKIVDKNGNYTYSLMKKITLEMQPTFMIIPNPATNAIKIAGITNAIGTMKSTVKNLTGQNVIEKNILQENDLNINTQALKSGMYFLILTEIKTGNIIGEMPFIKNN